MKIRTGFVSNSSSTSFTIYGISMDTYDLGEWLKENVELTEEDKEAIEDEGNYAIVELFEDLFGNWLHVNGFSVHTGYESEYTYIGVDPQSFPGDKTMNETKIFIGDVLKEKFPDNNTLTWHKECFRDG